MFLLVGKRCVSSVAEPQALEKGACRLQHDRQLGFLDGRLSGGDHRLRQSDLALYPASRP